MSSLRSNEQPNDAQKPTYRFPDQPPKAALQCPTGLTSLAVKTPQPFKITLRSAFCQSLTLS
jgi:hypothetical protein